MGAASKNGRPHIGGTMLTKRQKDYLKGFKQQKKRDQGLQDSADEAFAHNEVDKAFSEHRSDGATGHGRRGRTSYAIRAPWLKKVLNGKVVREAI